MSIGPARRTPRLTTMMLLLAAIAAGCAEAPDPRPNVILVSVDTLRADALGVYGAPIDTPTLDALAQRGALFERAYAPAALTAPSHATLLTGRDPLQHGIIGNGTPLDPELELVSEVFRDAGYASAAFVSSFVLDERFGWGQGFDVFDGEFSEEEATLPKELGTPSQFFLDHDFGGFDRRADASVDAAIEWIEDAPEPWFLFVHLFDPHDPYVPPPGYEKRVRGADFDLEGRTAPDARKPGRMERLVRRYHAEVVFTDEQLGRLLSAADATSSRRRITAITADHGEGLGQHDWLYHAKNLYDEALHVPLIVVDSAATSTGHRIETPVLLADVAPTLLELAGLPALSESGGLSLVGSVATGAEPPARPVFAHRRSYRGNPPGDRGEQFAVRDRDWKLIRREGPSEELFDLAEDPAELADRSRRLAGKDAARHEALGRLLDAYAAERRVSGEGPELSDEVRAALEALGYTE